MKLAQHVSYGSQRGIVAVMAVIFLITAVVFVLVQSLNITGTTSIDNKQQLNSTAALFLAGRGHGHHGQYQSPGQSRFQPGPDAGLLQHSEHQ